MGRKRQEMTGAGRVSPGVAVVWGRGLCGYQGFECGDWSARMASDFGCGVGKFLRSAPTTAAGALLTKRSFESSFSTGGFVAAEVVEFFASLAELGFNVHVVEQGMLNSVVAYHERGCCGSFSLTVAMPERLPRRMATACMGMLGADDVGG